MPALYDRMFRSASGKQIHYYNGQVLFIYFSFSINLLTANKNK